MDNNSKNVFIAIALSFIVIVGFDFFWGRYGKKAPELAHAVAQTDRPASMSPPPYVQKAHEILPKAEALRLSERVAIQAPGIKGSIRLKGLVFDDASLPKYKQTTGPKSDAVDLLSPGETSTPYTLQARWVVSQSSSVNTQLPSDDTVWTADHNILTPKTPVTFSWTNPDGVRFEQKVAIDEGSMLTITQTVVNNGEKPLLLGVQSVVQRKLPPKESRNASDYEGPLGVFNGELKRMTYDEIQKNMHEGQLSGKSSGETGWIGLSDKYWLVSLIPESGQHALGRISEHEGVYRAESVSSVMSIPAHQRSSVTTRAFVGAKQLALLDQYKVEHKIDRFDYAVDFGKFYPITKPLFCLLSWLKDICGNFGIAILLMTIFVKAVFFPLSNKSYKSMAAMKRIQPRLDALKEKFKNDKARLNQELFALYKKEKINPASGCLPMLIQIPVFFALYKVLMISIEMRHAPLFGWIHDLAAPDPTSVFNLFGALPWDVPSFLQIGVWPLIMGASMLIQQCVGPSTVTDPTQKVMFTYVMPAVFTYMLAQFPVGLVVYWTWSNVLTIAQQWVLSVMGKDKEDPLSLSRTSKLSKISAIFSGGIKKIRR